MEEEAATCLRGLLMAGERERIRLAGVLPAQQAVWGAPLPDGAAAVAVVAHGSLAWRRLAPHMAAAA